MFPTMSTSGEYHEYTGSVRYIGGYHYVCGRMFSTSGDTMSTLGGYHNTLEDVQYIGEYHEYIKGIS